MTPSRNVKRFSISLPPSLLERFDQTWKGMKYENRSKAVHDALQRFITEVQLVKREGPALAVVLVLHYLDKPSVQEDVYTVTYNNRKIVSSIQQTYVKENKALQIIFVVGNVDELETFTQEIMAVKGVKEVKTSIITP